MQVTINRCCRKVQQCNVDPYLLLIFIFPWGLSLLSYPFHNLTDILSQVHCTVYVVTVAKINGGKLCMVLKSFLSWSFHSACIEQYFFKMKGHGCQHFVFSSDLFSLPTLSYFPFPPIFVVIIILLTLISPNLVFQFPLLSLLFSSRFSPSLSVYSHPSSPYLF